MALTKQERENFSNIPEKALKKVLRLPSYQRQLENPSNSHDTCKARMSKIAAEDQFSLIKKSILKARSLISKNNFFKSSQLLEELTLEGICHSDIFYLLGESYRNLCELEKAEFWIQRSIQMKIHPPYCYFSMGKICQAKDSYRDSIQYFRQFLTRIEDPQGHYELGRSFMWLGLYEEAVEEYSIFIEQKRHINLDPAVLLLRAEAYEELERFDLARKDYKMVLELNRNFYAPYLEHAQELAASGRIQESKTIIQFVKKRTKFV